VLNVANKKPRIAKKRYWFCISIRLPKSLTLDTSRNTKPHSEKERGFLGVVTSTGLVQKKWI